MQVPSHEWKLKEVSGFCMFFKCLNTEQNDNSKEIYIIVEGYLAHNLS